MKQNKTSKLSLQKTTVSKLNSDQLNRVQGGTDPDALATVLIAFTVGVIYDMGKNDGRKNRTR